MAHRVGDDRERVDLGEACSAEGIDSTGTKAEEAKVSGKIPMKPIDWADSDELATMAMSAKIQEKA